MDKLRQAAEMALECLEYHWDNSDSELEDTPYVLEATQALRQALAETDHFRDATKKIEPVAWIVESKHGNWAPYLEWSEPSYLETQVVTALYTAPPKAAEWVGLSDEEIITHFQTNVNTGSLLSFADGVRYAEAKLRDKNAGNFY